ncbi:Exosomal 3'-5' exoribonuclease complex, subunit Rrp43 [Phaffia rhodozyma]|uniref:Ribosomal RNA-processing protein 43 n=1 Tax=Phaffia rhodozyma TaxID=264483 RepID=A0A0F7SKW7_PHARH|nr:Exosomal 3'-5' exoribonuclease complex, subunit Rrp43 [Phaffia rhodozyma]
MATPTTVTSSQLPEAANTPSHTLSASTFKRLHPQAYLERFFAEGYRPDGRKLSDSDDAWRDVKVNLGSVSTAMGSSLIRLGETTIVCGVKAETFEPDLYTPTDGCLVPNLDLPALSSPKFKPGPPGSEAQLLTDRLDRVLSHSSILPLSSLCIEKGKSAWVLYIDAVCINYDGNVWDACLLAVVAALRNTRLPVARWDDATGRTICSRTETVPLQLGNFNPISSTFGVFSSKTIFPDPTSFEEPLLGSTITCVLLQPLSSSNTDEKKTKAKVLFLEQSGLGGLSVGNQAVGSEAVLAGGQLTSKPLLEERGPELTVSADKEANKIQGIT